MLTIDTIKQNIFAEHLGLSYHQINDLDIPLICNFLIEHPEITHLDLSHNEITDIGAKALASNQSIQKLIVYGNSISEEGKKMLNEQDPHKQSNYGRQSGLTSKVPSLLKLSLFKATSNTLDLAKTPKECRALKPREIVDTDPYAELFFPEDHSNDRDYSFPSIDTSWKENTGKRNTPRGVSTSQFFGYRLGNRANTTSTALDLESLRAHRIAYFEPK